LFAGIVHGVVVHITAEILVPSSTNFERFPAVNSVCKVHTQICDGEFDVYCLTDMIVNILQFPFRKGRPRRRTPINRPQSTINHSYSQIRTNPHIPLFTISKNTSNCLISYFRSKLAHLVQM
jgi:hypothetical protein